MFGFKGEVVRNLTAYFLVLVGVPVAIYGGVRHVDKVAELGGTLVAAALLAFNKRSEQGEK